MFLIETLIGYLTEIATGVLVQSNHYVQGYWVIVSTAPSPGERGSLLPDTSALEEWQSGVSNNNITLDTLLASCYEARSILQVNISAMLRDKRTVYPEVPPPWQLTGINIAGRNAPRSNARVRREEIDANQPYMPFHTSMSGGVVLIVYYCTVPLVGGVTQSQSYFKCFVSGQ